MFHVSFCDCCLWIYSGPLILISFYIQVMDYLYYMDANYDTISLTDIGSSHEGRYLMEVKVSQYWRLQNPWKLFWILPTVYCTGCDRFRAPMAELLRVLFHHPIPNHLIAVSGEGSSPALITCETRQVLFAGVPGVFFLGVLPVSLHLLIGPSHTS